MKFIRFWKRATSKKAREVFSIDTLPIYNWFKFNDTQDYAYLGKGADESTYHALMSEFIEVFNFTSNQKKIFELQKELILLRIELALTGNRRIKNRIKIVNDELSLLSIPETSEKQDFYQSIHFVESVLKTNIDEKSMSVRKFFVKYKQCVKLVKSNNTV